MYTRITLHMHKNLNLIAHWCILDLPCSHQNQNQLEELYLEVKIRPNICSSLLTKDALSASLKPNTVKWNKVHKISQSKGNRRKCCKDVHIYTVTWILLHSIQVYMDNVPYIYITHTNRRNSLNIGIHGKYRIMVSTSDTLSI